MSFYDYIALALYFLSFFGYHCLYLFAAHKLEINTREKIITYYREKWLRIIQNENHPLLAIQTIRNLTMTGTYMVSLDLLLLGGLGTILSSNAHFGESLKVLNGINFHIFLKYLHDYPAALKLLVTVIMLLLSSYQFTVMLRILYNMNFTTSVSALKDENLDFQLEQIQRQAKHFMTGIRSLFYAIGPILWLMDTTVMIIFIFIITVSFFRFDFNAKRI